MKRLFSFLFTTLITLIIGTGSTAHAIVERPAKYFSPIQEQPLSLQQDGLVNTTALTTAAIEARAEQVYGQQSLHFEPNQGQTDEAVKFTARGPGYTLFLTGTEAVFSLAAPNKDVVATERHDDLKREEQPVNHEPPQVLRMQLGGKTLNKDPAIKGLEKQLGISNYYLGNDKKAWQTNVPHYSRVAYESVYPGIDMVYYGNPQQLEYDFVVAPGADPDQIQLAFEGADDIQLAENGNLKITIADRELAFKAPQIYQMKGGSQQMIAGRYVIQAGKLSITSKPETTRIGFQLAAYDTSLPLVIDPVVEYSTFLGGSGSDAGYSIAVDSSGIAYVTGETHSTDYPLANAVDSTLSGYNDAFVTQLDPVGQLVYSTYLGGSSFDIGYGIDLDTNGNVYVTGRTHSSDYPVMNAVDSTLSGYNDVFVTQLDPVGQLVYSTYLGGNDTDYGDGIAVDADGNAYVAGFTDSNDYPTINAIDVTLEGYTDAFVTKLDHAGQLVYSTYLGGSYFDAARGIAVDAGGNATVTGYTYSSDFPTLNAADATLSGYSDVFVTQLDTKGQLVYSTYLGGSNRENFDGRRIQRGGIAMDSSGNVYVTGYTSSSDFPTLNAFMATRIGSDEGFVTKFDSAGQLAYSTYLGANYGNDITVDGDGNAYITGETSFLFGYISNAIYFKKINSREAFVICLDGTGQQNYSTYLGGSDYDWGRGIDVDGFGNVYVTGSTRSSDFPLIDVTNPAIRGIEDAFVTKIGPGTLDFEVIVDTPTPYEMLPVPATLSGTATSPGGVGDVLVSIRDTVNDLWWTETGWGEWQRNSAVIDPSNSTSVSWNYAFDPAGTGGSGQYRAYVVARGYHEFHSTLSAAVQVPFNAFEDSAISLESIINVPVANEVVTLPTTLGGTASAAAGVSTVLVGIRDTVNDLWWDGANWGEWRLLPVPVIPVNGTAVDWSYDFDPGATSHSGQFRAYVRAEDTNGAWSTSAQVLFSVAP